MVPCRKQGALLLGKVPLMENLLYTFLHCKTRQIRLKSKKSQSQRLHTERYRKTWNDSLLGQVILVFLVIFVTNVLTGVPEKDRTVNDKTFIAMGLVFCLDAEMLDWTCTYSPNHIKRCTHILHNPKLVFFVYSTELSGFMLRRAQARVT